MVIGYDRKEFTALSIGDKVIKNIAVIYMHRNKSCCCYYLGPVIYKKFVRDLRISVIS
jgi:hypothetical protein